MATVNIVPNPNNSDSQNIGTSSERWTALHGDKVGTSRVSFDVLADSPTDTSNLLYDLNGVLHYGDDPVGTGSSSAAPTVAKKEYSYNSALQGLITLPSLVFENDLGYLQLKVNGLQVPSSNLSFSTGLSTGTSTSTAIVYDPTGLYPLEDGDHISVWWLTSNGSSSGGGGTVSGQEWLLYTFIPEDASGNFLTTPGNIAVQSILNEPQAMLFINGVRVPNSELTFGNLYLDISQVGYTVDLATDKVELFYIQDTSGTGTKQ